MIHPRVSANAISSWNYSLQADMEMWKEIGVDNVGLTSVNAEGAGWSVAPTLVQGVRVSNVATERRVIPESIDFAAAVGSPILYMPSGIGASELPWDKASRKFTELMAPHVEHANRKGVRLGVESTMPSRTDLSFLYTFRDAADAARAAGISVVLDLFGCWYEHDLDRIVRDNIDILSLVQICDVAVSSGGSSSPSSAPPARLVIGDGNLPLEQMFDMILGAGYEGDFDLEIIGPHIEAEGYVSAIGRSLLRASEILDRLGV